MQLRPYQIETISQLRESFRSNHQRVILCLPTGAGKTVVFSEMVVLASERRTQTLVLTDRIELFAQTFKALRRHNIEIQEVTAKTTEMNFNPHALVTVGMVETVKRRLLLGYSPQLIIVDEAHKGNFTKVLSEIYPDAKVIGATATPVGKHIPKLYQSMVQTIDIPDLISQGYLSPCQAFQMQDDFSDLTVQNGEYTDASQYEHFNKRKLYDGVVQEYQKRTPG